MSPLGPGGRPAEASEITRRFTRLIRRPDDDIPLDECAFLLAAHDHDVDIDGQLARLDDLASRCADRTFDGLRRHLFVVEGFRGDGTTYDDPANSFLDRVVDRGLGIPITLAVVAIEVGRRVGVPIRGMNTPGHFLARHKRTVFDPFHGGVSVDPDDAKRILDQHLEAATTRTILDRMLGNLQARYLATNDVDALIWVLRLRMAFPGVPPARARELAGVLSAQARYDEAAAVLEEHGGEEGAKRAHALRAKLNELN